MSLEPRNLVCDGPDVFSKVLAIGIDPLSSSGEGSPIYLTIDAEATVSGSYTDGAFEYAFSGSTAIDQLNRIEIRSIVGGVDIAGENYEVTRDNDISSWVDFGFVTLISENEFVAAQSNILGCNGGTPPFAPPGFYHNQIFDAISGTRTDTDEDPDLVLDRSIGLVFNPPYFTGSIQAGDLKMIISMEATVNEGDPDEYTELFEHEVDCSTWTTLDFRDIRGTYGDTSYDVNGIEYIWSVTIG